MPTRETPASTGSHHALRIRSALGEEIRRARVQSGLSQRTAASGAGISAAQFGRIERAEIRRPTVEQLSRACAAVGLRIVVKAYPDGDPIRDAPHRRLLDRLRRRLPVGTAWRTEVPLPIPGDRRAWDAVARRVDQIAACEAETALRDVQALERRIALKQRDGGIAVVILLVSDTRANRLALETSREALRTRFPLSGRQVLASLAAGRLPDRSGIVVL